MSIIWTLKQIPELSTLEKAERARRWKIAYGKAFHSPQAWNALAAAGASTALGGVIGRNSGNFWFGTIIGCFFGYIIFSQLLIKLVRKHHSDALNGQIS